MKTRLATALLGLAALGLANAAHADQTVVIGYQTGTDPAKVPEAEGTYEKASGYKIDWRKFDTGAEVVTALASGSIQVGYVGSSPAAAAATREIPVKVFYVAALLGESEELVVRNGSGITSPADLKGKKIATPFVSTSHYSLLAALKHWHVDPKSVQVLNLRPPEIAAAWQRGDIDGAYVWDPALTTIKESGTVLASSGDVAKWGSPTFDVWLTRDDFAASNPGFLTSFARVTSDAYAAYRQNPAAWTAESQQAKDIAKVTGIRAADVPEALKGSLWPTLAEEAKPALLGGGTVKALAKTSRFLVEQKKLPAALADYRPYVTDQYVKAAVASK
jgi:taurine transport system substrate-binding protein